MPKTFTTPALTDNGSTEGLQLEGIITVSATGTFGSGTLTLQGSTDNTNWFNLTNASGSSAAFTADGATNIEIGQLWIRGTLSGATSPSVTVTYAPQRHTSKFL